MRWIFSICLILTAGIQNISAQNSKITENESLRETGISNRDIENDSTISQPFDKDSIYIGPLDSMASFATGQMGMIKFINANLQISIMEKIATEKIKGRLFVGAIIDTNGNVLEPKIMKGIGVAEIENEFIRIFTIMPRWKPARVDNKVVKVRVSVPIILK